MSLRLNTDQFVGGDGVGFGVILCCAGFGRRISAVGVGVLCREDSGLVGVVRRGVLVRVAAGRLSLAFDWKLLGV